MKKFPLGMSATGRTHLQNFFKSSVYHYDLARFLRAMSSHKMQDEPGAKSITGLLVCQPRLQFSVNQFETAMQADFLPEAGSYVALRRLQNRLDEGKTLCRTSE